MTRKEIKAKVEAMKKYTEHVKKSASESRKLLTQAGILTKKGNLRKPYK